MSTAMIERPVAATEDHEVVHGGRLALLNYDHVAKRTFVRFLDRGDPEAGRPQSILADRFAVRHARFIVQSGYRKECVETGRLGFVEGESLDAVPDVSGLARIRWSGTDWRFEGGGVVLTARTVVIIDGRVYAEGAH